MRPETIQLWKERCVTLRETFGRRLFTAEDAAEILKINSNTIVKVFRILARRRVVFCIVHALVLREYGKKSTRNYYSFDRSWTEEDAIDEIIGDDDPIPEEERTLEIQLFGDERKRYEEIRARRMRFGTMRMTEDDGSQFDDFNP